jgi:NADPH-dependent 2,4-dienoyl-CoA reductase/sulfur reductase-like enzyme
MRRLVVVGADAAGMSAASQALRVAQRCGDPLEVVVLERTQHTSYSACGLPYWIAGDVESGDALVARTPAEHRANGIDLRLGAEVTALDLSAGHVDVRMDGSTTRVGFDELLLATGAEALMPDWARDVPGALPIKTLDDGAAWRSLLAGTGDGPPKRGLVVGGGYIGVEVAEAFVRRGIETTLVNRSPELFGSSLDPDMGALVRVALEKIGVTVVTGVEITGLDRSVSGGIAGACVGGEEHVADIVAVAIGVRPRVSLAVEAGIELGAYGALAPDDHQRLAPGVWAAGDCCEVFDRVIGHNFYVPLGTHANKAGRVAGTNIGGGDARFEGVVGTAITRGGDAEVSRAGVLSEWATARGWPVEVVTLESTTASGYMPEADPVTVRVIASRDDARLVGTQIVGGRGAGKRIDIAAMAMWGGMTVHDVAAADLAYAPPFSPVWDPVQIACRKASEQLGG